MTEKMLFAETDIRMRGAVALETGRDATYEFELLAESYHQTANAAVEALSEDELFERMGWGSVSFRAFPVIFLYRQALELMIKAIIVAGLSMVEYDGGDVDMRVVYGEHNFEKLRPIVERVMETMSFGWDFGVPRLRDLKDFRRLLAEFDEFDPTSTVGRYPVNGAGNPSMDQTHCFNLFRFAETMDQVLEALAVAPGAISATVDEYFSHLSEMR